MKSILAALYLVAAGSALAQNTLVVELEDNPQAASAVIGSIPAPVLEVTPQQEAVYDYYDDPLNTVIYTLARDAGMMFFPKENLDKVKFKGRLAGGQPVENLSRILPSFGLKGYTEGGTYYVFSEGDLASLPTTEQIFPIRYLRQSDVEGLMAPFIGAGKLKYSDKTNSLIVSGNRFDLARVRELLTTLDVPRKGIVFTLNVLTAKRKTSRDLGVDWSSTFGGGGYRWTFGANNSLQMVYNIALETFANPTAAILNPAEVSAAVKALEEISDVTTVVKRVLPSEDNDTVKYRNVDKFPITEYKLESSGNAGASDRVTSKTRYSLDEAVPPTEPGNFLGFSFQAKATYLEQDKIRVTAEAANTVLTELQTVRASATIPETVVPRADFSETKTNTILRAGQTIVWGGSYGVDDNGTLQRVPLLSDIPLLGELFKSRSKTKDATNQIIFLTVDRVEPQELPQGEGAETDPSVQRQVDRLQEKLPSPMIRKAKKVSSIEDKRPAPRG